MTKKKYAKPALAKLGNLESVTQYVGLATTDDSFTFSGVQVNADGSCGGPIACN